MDILGVGILVFCFVLIIGLYFCAELIKNLQFKISISSRAEIEPSGEETRPFAGNHTAKGALKLLKFESKQNAETASTKAAEEPEKENTEFWDDLAALERERENIENGAAGAETGEIDRLDYVRSVHERIAELREANPQPPAAA